MGINSTDVAYNFGQFGSTFLKGDGAKLLLTASTAKYYVCAITMITDVAFQALESLDGGVNMGMGDTAFVGTDVLAIDTMWNATAADTTNETNEDADAIATMIIALGKEKMLSTLETLEKVEYYIIVQTEKGLEIISNF